MDPWYSVLLYIHILSAIMSIGPFFIFIPVMKKLKAAEPLEQNAYLSTFRSAIRLAKHAGHVLVASGILLVLVGSWAWSTSWIVMTIVLLVGSLLFLARAFSPKIRKFNEPDQNKDAIIRLLNRALWIYLALLLCMLAFMIVKPTLW
ncbi:conserved hypothetical protein [Paenibacillus curdlanolyticus YK9]|uniref:DUF2269 family protein n=2 Tax=Paenibacillus curdlanolyticus TaxID=59840 RepID=E0ICW2_9BACL|nr:conserved hypothetical protein [Paenibacillus curdlanolyticus YK9]